MPTRSTGPSCLQRPAPSVLGTVVSAQWTVSWPLLLPHTAKPTLQFPLTPVCSVLHGAFSSYNVGHSPNAKDTEELEPSCLYRGAIQFYSRLTHK